MASDSPPASRKKQERVEIKQAFKQATGAQRRELIEALKQTTREDRHIPELRSLKERQREERGELILCAADELFLETGYHDTSIDDIAARVGISKGTVYLHFASKEDLVVALLERGMRQLQATLDEILAAPGTPREKLYAVMRQMCSSMMSRQRLQLVEALFHTPELHGRLMERRETFGKLFGKLWEEPQNQITALFEEGKAAGEFDPDTPTPIMLSLFWGMVNPRHFKTLIVEKQMSSDLVVAHLGRCFFKGIAPGGPPCPDYPSDPTNTTNTTNATNEGSSRASDTPRRKPGACESKPESDQPES